MSHSQSDEYVAPFVGFDIDGTEPGNVLVGFRDDMGLPNPTQDQIVAKADEHYRWLEEEIAKDPDNNQPKIREEVKYDVYAGIFTDELIEKIRRRREVLEITPNRFRTTRYGPLNNGPIRRKRITMKRRAKRTSISASKNRAQRLRSDDEKDNENPNQ